MADVVLPPDYYLSNFRAVLRQVAERDARLLTDVERDFLSGFDALSPPAQMIYVRLISRQGPWFRRDRLKYAEIPDLQLAIEEILRAGFAVSDEAAATAELLDLLTVEELRSLARACAGGDAAARTLKAARREDWVRVLRDRFDEGELRRHLRTTYPAVSPTRARTVRLLFLLFFGNLAQDGTDFVLRDLGLARYENYPLFPEGRLFPTREALEQRLALGEAADELEALVAADDDEAVLHLARGLTDREWAEAFRSRLGRVLNFAARHMERAERAHEALGLYAHTDEPPSRERRVRLLHSLNRLDEACELTRRIAESPRDESEKDFAAVFWPKLCKAANRPVPPVTRSKPTIMERAYPHEPGLSPEAHVLLHLEGEGRNGFFSENHLWRSLFGLAFWDVIFQPLPGAFHHPFQTGPLDLYTPEFYERRRDGIHARLDEIVSTPDLKARLLARFDEKFGVANDFVWWSGESRAHIAVACERVPKEALAKIFRRMAFDPKRNMNGFPDLFVYEPDGTDFALWEVKGPGDQLRPEQRAWLGLFGEWGVDAAVLKVTWRESRKNQSVWDAATS